MHKLSPAPGPVPGRNAVSGFRRLGPLQWLGLITGAVLLGDAVVLMARGMFNLGVTLPAVLGLLFMACSFWRPAIARRLRASAWLRRAWWLGWAALAMWLVSLLVFWAHLLSASSGLPTDQQVQAIVVLGSATRDGQPSLTLAQRLDRAAELAARQPKALVLTSGGVDFGESESEGAIMARYLQQRHGLPPERLLMEERSTSTALNLAWSLPLLQARGVEPQAAIAIVTSDFHTLRAGWIAERSGYGQAFTVGAPTPVTIRANAWLREYFAVISGWVLGEF
ncbi:YdcF family protein [Delftia acidovorans]|uniref:YdcF family protein n=1 Tax=Delftia acidovorans TaxID=80866 RepID=UPI0032DE8678